MGNRAVEGNQCGVLFDQLKAGFERETFPSLRCRIDRLQRLKQMLDKNESRLIDALMADYGYRSPNQTAFADVTTTVKSANHAIRHLKFWMQREPRSTDLSLRFSGAVSAVEYAPKGVVGVISPWNFPINLALSPAVSAIAAGNRVLIKPSEVTAHTASLTQELVSSHFAPDEMAVICGGVDIAQDFVRLPLNHLIYTGGTAIAKDIMAAAAQNLTPLTLELGGKSPVLIDTDANIRLAAQRVAFGKFFNAGQICIAPDYVLLGEHQLDLFLAELQRAVNHQSSASASRDDVDIINDRHRERLAAMVSSAEAAGARVHLLDAENSPYRLTVVVADEHCGEIGRHEIFGPALLIRTTSSFGQAIEIVNSHSLPLVIYYFGNRRESLCQLQHQTRSGAVVQNDVIFQYANDDLPFGGIGDSGMGRYRGRDGFVEFSNQRAFFRGGVIDVAPIVTPPYPRFFRSINRIMRSL